MPKSQSQSETKTETKTKTGRPAGATDSDGAYGSTETPEPQDPSPTQDIPAATSQDSDAARLATLMYDEFFRRAETDPDPSMLRRMTKDAAAALRSRYSESLRELMSFAKNQPWWRERITAAAYPMAFFAKSLGTLAEQHETAKRPRPKEVPAKGQPTERAKPDVSGAMSWLNTDRDEPKAEAQAEETSNAK
jgi:hypothetical protein